MLNASLAKNVLRMKNFYTGMSKQFMKKINLFAHIDCQKSKQKENGY